MSDHTHDGHRSRLRAQFRESGMDSLSSVQVLEMLLFHSVPRVDTNPLAHRLLDRFGRLPEVLDANFEQLRSVEGVSENTATLILFAAQLMRRYQREKVRDLTIFNSLEEMGHYLQAQFANEGNEKLRIMCLNNRGKLLNCSVISEGSVSATSVNVRLLIETALRYPTTAVVMAHNHPAGFAFPSWEDYDCTIQVRKALEPLDIRLVDHLVFSQDDFVSMRQSTEFSSAFSRYTRDGSAPDWLQ